MLVEKKLLNTHVDNLFRLYEHIFFSFQPNQVRICENCLKITRAPQAYQQCCSNTNNAFSWCERIYKYSVLNNRG